MSDYEHDGTGILDGWPQRVPIGNGVEVDARFLAWLSYRIRPMTPRWDQHERLQEAWAAAAHLSAGFDPSKSKIETWLTNYGPDRIIREYCRQYRMAGCKHQPIGNGIGWVNAVADLRTSAIDPHDILDQRVEPPPPKDDSYREVLDVLMTDCTEQEVETLESRMHGHDDGVLASRRGCSNSAVGSSYKRAILKMREAAKEIGVTSERLW